MFNNRLWIPFRQDRAQASTHNSIPDLTLARIDEKAKARQSSENTYELGDPQDSPPLNMDDYVDDVRLTMKKKSYCPFTGAIHLVCLLLKPTGSRGETVLSGKPMLRPLNSILKRPLDSILKRRQIQAITNF